MKKFANIRTAGLALTVAGFLTLTGCEIFSGGGWIVSKAGGKGRATFGLNLSCSDDGFGTAKVSGDLQYIDHGWLLTPPGGGKARQLAFHGTPTKTSPIPTVGCVEFDQLFGTGTYEGEYLPQPANLGAGGHFIINVQDNGPAGPDTTDHLGIILLGGVYDGYSNSGTLQGGNITMGTP